MSVNQISNGVIGETNEQKNPIYEEYQNKLDSYKTQWSQFDTTDKGLIGDKNCSEIEKKLLDLQEMINTEAEEAKIDELINSLYNLMFGGIFNGYKSEWENFSASEKKLLGSEICDKINGDITKIEELLKQGGNETEISKLIDDLKVLFFGNSECGMSLKDRIGEIQLLNNNRNSFNSENYNKLLKVLQSAVVVSLEDFTEMFSGFVNNHLNEELSNTRHNNSTKNMSMAMKVILSQSRYKEFEMENIAYDKLEQRAKIDPEMKKHLEEGIGVLDNDSLERRVMILREEAKNEIKNRERNDF